MVLVARRVILDETRRIERLRLAIGRRDRTLGRLAVDALLSAAARGEPHRERTVGEEPPRLVEERPLVDRGMVEVALDHALEALPVLLEHLLGGIAPRAGDVRLDENAQLVRPVELPRHLDLDVHAVAVQAQLLREEDLVLHELVRRERIPPVRMVALVEAELQVDGLSVQRHVAVTVRGLARADLAEAEIGLHRVVPERQLHVVKVRIVQRPETGLVELEESAERQLSRPDGTRIALAGHFHPQHHVRLRRSAERRRQLNPSRLDVRREGERIEVDVAARLEVDRLPDAAGVAVALLAVEIVSVLRHLRGRIPDPERKRLRLAPLHEVGEFELERRVAARMGAEVLSVKGAGRRMVRRADDHEDAFAPPRGGHRHAPAVVADVPFVLDAGELAAPAERHHDLTVVLARLEAEVPFAVQVHPLIALPVGTRMLRKRNLRGKRERRAQHGNCQQLSLHFRSPPESASRPFASSSAGNSSAFRPGRRTSPCSYPSRIRTPSASRHSRR